MWQVILLQCHSLFSRYSLILTIGYIFGTMYTACRDMSTSPEQSSSKLTIIQDDLRARSPPSRHILIIDNHTKTANIVPWEPFPTLSSTPSDDHANLLAPHFNAEVPPLQEPIRGFKGFDGRIRLFRPMDMLRTMDCAIGEGEIPEIDPEELLKCIDILLHHDSGIFKVGEMISIQLKQYHIFSGSSPSKSSKLYCSAVPSKSNLNLEGDFKPLKLYAHDCIENTDSDIELKDEEAYKNGCDEFLYLYNKEILGTYKATDGDSNFFVVWINDEKKKQVVTYPLESDDYVLPGIMRDSVLQMLTEVLDKDLEVIERRFDIDELSRNVHENNLVEAFSCGHFGIISPVSIIKTQNGEILNIPTVIENKWGELSKKLYETLIGIMRGDIEHDWSHISCM